MIIMYFLEEVKKLKKKLILVLIGVSLLITACGKVPKLENGKDAVVSLKEGNIAVDDLYNEMKESYALNILLDMIDSKILNELYKTDKEEQDYVKSQVEQAENYYKTSYSTYYSSFEEFLTNGYGVKDKEDFEKKLALSYKRTKATEEYAKSLVKDKEIEKYYKDKTIGDIKASHILIKPKYKDDATDEEKEKANEEAKKKAEEIIEKLKKGKKFADLAKEYSDDGSSEKGGELDWFNRGDMVSEFEEAAIKLEKDKYTTTPVKTEYGYHIILKTDQKEKPALKDVKDKIIETLAKEKQEEDTNIQAKALIQLRKDHKVTIEDTSLNKKYKTYVDNINNK